MAKSKTIAEWIEEAETLAKTYEEVSGTEIPHSIKEAKEQGWQLLPKGVIITGLVNYSHEEQRADSTRVIPLPLALRALEAMEDDLIASTLKNGSQLFVRRVRGQIAMLKYAGTAMELLWDLVKFEWEQHGLLELILDAANIVAHIIDAIVEIATRFGGLIISGMISVFSLNVFSRTVLDVQKVRIRWEDQIRKNALPQRNQRRVFRRKVSRL